MLIIQNFKQTKLIKKIRFRKFQIKLNIKRIKIKQN